MKKFVSLFLMVCGVLFLLEIVFLVYFYIADPLNLKRLFISGETEVSTPSSNASNINDTSHTTDKNPLLNARQESVVESVGIDPAALPSTISPEQEKCFINLLGETRAEEIKAGDAPSVSEVLRSTDCL